jgi:hypothetical protein
LRRSAPGGGNRHGGSITYARGSRLVGAASTPAPANAGDGFWPRRRAHPAPASPWAGACGVPSRRRRERAYVADAILHRIGGEFLARRRASGAGIAVHGRAGGTVRAC